MGGFFGLGKASIKFKKPSVKKPRNLKLVKKTLTPKKETLKPKGFRV